MSKKIKDAEKKCARLGAELEKAKENVKEAELKLVSKQEEFDSANMNLVNLLLVEHQLTIQDLPELLSDLARKNNNSESSYSKESYLQ